MHTVCSIWLYVGICIQVKVSMESRWEYSITWSWSSGNFEGPNVGVVNPAPLLHKSNVQVLNHWVISRPNLLIFNFSSKPAFLFFATWIHWTKHSNVLVRFCLKSPYSDFPDLSDRKHKWLPVPRFPAGGGGGQLARSFSALSRPEWWRTQMVGACRHSKPVVSSPRHTRDTKQHLWAMPCSWVSGTQ